MRWYSSTVNRCSLIGIAILSAPLGGKGKSSARPMVALRSGQGVIGLLRSRAFLRGAGGPAGGWGSRRALRQVARRCAAAYVSRPVLRGPVRPAW
jgi:hypothetical protein